MNRRCGNSKRIKRFDSTKASQVAENESIDIEDTSITIENSMYIHNYGLNLEDVKNLADNCYKTQFDESSYGATDLLAVKSIEEVLVTESDKKKLKTLEESRGHSVKNVRTKTGEYYDFHLVYLKEQANGKTRVCLEELIRVEHSYSHCSYLTMLKCRGYVDCRSCKKWTDRLPDFLRKSCTLKIYKCLRCGKSCNSKAELVRHSRKHMGVTNATCTVCRKQFRYNDTLRMHYFKKHTL